MKRADEVCSGDVIVVRDTKVRVVWARPDGGLIRVDYHTLLTRTHGSILVYSGHPFEVVS